MSQRNADLTPNQRAMAMQLLRVAEGYLDGELSRDDLGTATRAFRLSLQQRPGAQRRAGRS